MTDIERIVIKAQIEMLEEILNEYESNYGMLEKIIVDKHTELSNKLKDDNSS